MTAYAWYMSVGRSTEKDFEEFASKESVAAIQQDARAGMAKLKTFLPPSDIARAEKLSETFP